MNVRKQNSSAHPLQFMLVSSTDHVTPVTGATPNVQISKNGAAFAAPAGASSELGNGWYQLAGNATDTNTLGPLLVHVTATGADPTDEEFLIVAYDPDAAYVTGTNLPANFSAMAITVGGAVTVGTNNDKGGYSLAGNVTVGGYATGQDPATLILVTPANKLATDSGNRVTVGTNADKVGYDLVNAPNATAITAIANGLLDLASAIDPAGGADTLRKALRLILASAAGKLSGGSTTTNTINDTTGAKNRIVAAVDTNGNRTAITYDMT